MTARLLAFLLVATVAWAQLPPRIQIPGAVFLESPKPRARVRPPPQSLATSYSREVRPVNEEPEDLQDPVVKLVQTQRPLQQQLVEIEPETEIGVQYRQEQRPEVSRQIPFSPTLRPVTRQELKQQIPSYLQQAQPQRQQEVPAPHLRRVQQPVARPAPRPASRPAPQYLDEDEGHRTRKPPVQILRKYRTDNADGSITWGYENEDGSFKEETIGIDCITRGKYGYIDPDGVKREYTYETGGTCEEPEEELEDLPPGRQPQNPKGNKPLRPPPQYVN